MGAQLKTNGLDKLIGQLRNRYEDLNNREQRLVLALVIVIIGAGLWLTAIAPAVDALTTTRRNLADKQAQASRVVALADTVAALREQGGSRGQSAADPLQLLKSRIDLMQWQESATVQDRGDGVFAVDLNSVPALDALDWLDNTERLTGLQLQNLSIEKISTGTVNIRSQWVRPGGAQRTGS